MSGVLLPAYGERNPVRPDPTIRSGGTVELEVIRTGRGRRRWAAWQTRSPGAWSYGWTRRGAARAARRIPSAAPRLLVPNATTFRPPDPGLRSRR